VPDLVPQAAAVLVVAVVVVAMVVVAMVVVDVLVVDVLVVVMGFSFGRAGRVAVGAHRAWSVAVGLGWVLVLCHEMSSGAW
jgi:hypothetical protein